MPGVVDESKRFIIKALVLLLKQALHTEYSINGPIGDYMEIKDTIDKLEKEKTDES